MRMLKHSVAGEERKERKTEQKTRQSYWVDWGGAQLGEWHIVRGRGGEGERGRGFMKIPR